VLLETEEEPAGVDDGEGPTEPLPVEVLTPSVSVCEGPAGVDEAAEPTGVVEGEGPTELALEATPSVLVCEEPADVDEGDGPAEADEADGPAEADEADGPASVDEVDGPVELALEAPIPSVLVCEGVAELPTGTEAV
jgi:hypothetical protein